jgi:hypothetical protein
VAGTINPNYIYDIALRASSSSNPDVQNAPLPTLSSNNPNGRMAGSPTHFVEFYAPASDPTIEPFVLYRFSLQSEVPNPSDPNNAINLASWARSGRGRIVNFTPVTTGSSNTLQFSIFTNMLADTDAAANALESLQVNLLTMNRISSQGGGNRTIDSLGDNNSSSGINTFLKVDLRASGSYNNLIPGPGYQIEPTGDCPDPDLDVTDFSIDVAKP